MFGWLLFGAGESFRLFAVILGLKEHGFQLVMESLGWIYKNYYMYTNYFNLYN